MTYRTMLKVLFAVIVPLFAACGDGNDTTAGDLEQQTEEATNEAQETAENAREAAQDAWASVRTDAERLLDQIRTQDAPRLKEQLLDRCRDALERLRQAESERAGEVDQLCNRIRSTEVTNSDVWTDIKREIDQLDPAA